LVKSSDGSLDNVVKGLVACALFVCYETFTGNYQVSYMHLQNGLQIITRESRKARLSTIPKDILQVFKCLDLQAITFGDSSVPYADHLTKVPIELLTSPPTGFDSIEDSIDVVLRLCRWLFTKAAAEYCPIPPEHLQSARNVLEQWDFEIERFVAVQKATSKGNAGRAISLVKMYKMYQIILTIITAIGTHGQETFHDDHLPKYKELINLGEELLLQNPAPSQKFFCFDIGVIFPLFWISIKCRDSQIRRRALKLLSSLHHQEGAWKASSVARAAEFVIGIEEEGLPPGVTEYEVGEIPETSRVHYLNTTVDAKGGKIHLGCLMRRNVDDASWYIRDGVVPYDAGFSYSLEGDCKDREMSAMEVLSDQEPGGRRNFHQLFGKGGLNHRDYLN
jgi:hypothetical protein